MKSGKQGWIRAKTGGLALWLCLTPGLAFGQSEEAPETPEAPEAVEAEEIGTEAEAVKTGQETDSDPVQEAQPPIEASAAPAFDVPQADLILWLAGRPSLPATSASRSGERGAEERAALTRLATLVAEDSDAWREYLSQRLEVGSEEDEAWCATARVVGALGEYQLADKLVFELSPGRPPERRAAAKAGLRELFGRWFEAPGDVADFLGQLEGGPGTRLLLAELAREEERSRDRLLAYLETMPGQALAHLDGPDPRIRERVAALVARDSLGQAASSDEPNLAYEALVRRVDEEPDSRAFHAALDAVLSLVENAPEDATRSIAFRRQLLQRLGEVNVARAASIARALPRVPWPVGSNGTGDNLLGAVEHLGRALRGFLDTDDQAGVGRAPDADAIVITLQSLRTLAERARGSELAASLRESSARDPVVAIVRDAGQADGVRTAAVAAFGPLASPKDGPFFVDVLRSGDSARVSHAVLGALRPILLEFKPNEVGALDVMREVARLTGAEDPDLRRRAFALLSDPELDRLARTLDPVFLIERLGTEASREGLVAIFSLLRRLGTSALAEELVGLTRFDELASGDGELVRELASTLESLAGSDALALLDAARRLVAAPGYETRLTRVLRALRMAARLGEDDLGPLTSEDHLAIASWSYELHSEGVSLLDEIPEGRAFLQRLAGVSLPIVKGLGPEQFGVGAYAHLEAVARALSLPDEPSPELLQAIEQDFTTALEVMASEAGTTDRIHRDRARFFFASGRDEKSRADYVLLLDSELLDHSDLRTAAGLFAKSEDFVRCFDFLDRLVLREPWRSEASAVRVGDLSAMRDAAKQAGGERRDHFLQALSGLPEAVPQNGGETPPGALWAGLEQDAERLAELHAIHADLAPPAPVEELPAEEIPPPAEEAEQD